MFKGSPTADCNHHPPQASIGANSHTPSTSQAPVAAVAPVQSRLLKNWDPLAPLPPSATSPSFTCSTRIKRDLSTFYADPPQGVFLTPQEDDMTLLHALILGPYDTPYEGGFFYFVIRCLSDYPIRAPQVRFMSTGGGRVRFNPNLYREGKVCLSILGTWSGPAWSPAQSLSSVLLSVQSLLSEKPYHNEPGFELERRPGDAARYNQVIRFETLRVAVCNALEGNSGMPETLVDVMRKSFAQFWDSYEAALEELSPLEGTPFQDPFQENTGSFQVAALRARLERLKAKYPSEDAD